MRTFEMLILVTLLLTLIGLFVARKKRPHLLSYFPGLAVILTVFHLIVEKARWQMVPIYILTVFLFILSIILIKRQSRKRVEPASEGRRVIGIILSAFGVLCLFISALPPVLFPVFRLPKPSGPYKVGTTVFQFLDRSRLETLTDDPNDHREFMARVWYPAEPPLKASPVPYRKYSPPIGSILQQGTASFGKQPPDFIFSHLDLLKSNSYLDAPVANTPSAYPVICFSTGFLSDLDENQIYFEELSSHGYVVISLNQPFESQSVVQPGGRIVPFSQAHAQEFQRTTEETTPLWKEFWESKNLEERATIAKQILEKGTFLDKIIRIRSEDYRFLATELNRLNSGERKSLLAGRLDISKLGIFGYSGGGAVAGQLCAVDSRFKAGINLDGFQFGDVIRGKVEQPFMLMYSEGFAGSNDSMIQNFRNATYEVTIKGTRHMDYSDNPLIFPLSKRIGMSGPISSRRMLRITNDYILSFFDKYLKGKDAALLDGPPLQYPEVIFKKLDNK